MGGGGEENMPLDSQTLRAEVENMWPFSEPNICSFRNDDLKGNKPIGIFFYIFIVIVLHQIIW